MTDASQPATPAPPPDLLTSRDVARILGVSLQYARRLLCSGKIRGAVRVGRDWGILATDFANYTPPPPPINKYTERPVGYTKGMRQSGYVGRRRRRGGSKGKDDVPP